MPVVFELIKSIDVYLIGKTPAEIETLTKPYGFWKDLPVDELVKLEKTLAVPQRHLELFLFLFRRVLAFGGSGIFGSL